jgi:hypothetical protein
VAVQNGTKILAFPMQSERMRTVGRPVEKGSMNVNSREQAEVNKLNVVSLFKESNADLIMKDPLTELMKEAEIQDEVLEVSHVRMAKIVNENQFPDQSMYILEEQLSNLRSSLNRIKFYLEELDEIIPR